MIPYKKILVLLIFSLLCGAAHAQTVSIRMVEGYNSKDKATFPAELNDVKSLLQSNLPFNTYKLIGSNAVKLPADQTANLGQGYSISCKGNQQSLAVKILFKNKVKLNSTVRLQPGKPLIIGGFSSGKGKILFVMKLQ